MILNFKVLKIICSKTADRNKKNKEELEDRTSTGSVTGLAHQPEILNNHDNTTPAEMENGSFINAVGLGRKANIDLFPHLKKILMCTVIFYISGRGK